MEILLVNPYIHDLAAYDLWSRPLGLLYIAAMLEQGGYRVRWLDVLDRFHPRLIEQYGRPAGQRYGCGHFPATVIPTPPQYAQFDRPYRRYGWPLALLEQELKQFQAVQAVLVTSMMTYWYPGVCETIRILRRCLPGRPVALGGVYASLCPEHARNYTGADVVLPGPGELAALRWVDAVCGQKHDYGAWEMPLWLPRPAHHLLSPGQPAAVVTSLGCPGRCSFCASGQLQPTFRQRAPQAVLAEIGYLVKRRLKDIAFYDDALLVNADSHAMVIFQELIQRRWQVRFHLPNGMHSSLVDQRIAQLCQAINVKTLRLSYEPRQGVADPALATAVTHLQAAGYRGEQIEIYVKVGLPGQELAQAVAALLWVHRLGVVIRLTEYSPVPGTPDFAKAAAGELDLKEPLLHNNSTYAIMAGFATATEFQELKRLVGVLNYATRQHLNLMGSSRIGRLWRRLQHSLPGADG